LCTRAEIDWFLNGIQWFFPEVHAELVQDIPEAERGNLLQAFKSQLFCKDPAIYTSAARRWSHYEGSCLYLLPQQQAIDDFSTDVVSLGVGRLEAHYFLNDGFFSEDQLVRNVDRIRHLPAVIIQGRYDVVCPPLSAYRLHQAWPEAQFHMVPDAGHAALEPGILAALISATEQFKTQRRFD
jgi:proline iminopeptidase